MPALSRFLLPSPDLLRSSARSGCALAALVLMLAACGHPSQAGAQPQAGCEAAPGQPASASMRLLVGFRNLTAGDASHTLEQLHQLSGACVRYLSSVSPTVHVYEVSGVNDLAAVRAKWLAAPGILAVESDVRGKAH